MGRGEAYAGHLIDEARERAYPGKEAVAVNEAVRFLYAQKF
jgi:hypothetical protein